MDYKNDWKKSVALNTGIKDPANSNKLNTNEKTKSDKYKENIQKAHQDSLVEQTVNSATPSRTVKDAEAKQNNFQTNNDTSASNSKYAFSNSFSNQQQKSSVKSSEDVEKKSLMARDQFTADDYKTNAEKNSERSKKADDKSDIMNYGANKKIYQKTHQDEAQREYGAADRTEESERTASLTLSEKRAEVREKRNENAQNHTHNESNSYYYENRAFHNSPPNNPPTAAAPPSPPNNPPTAAAPPSPPNNPPTASTPSSPPNGSGNGFGGGILDNDTPSEIGDQLPDVRRAYLKHNLHAGELPEDTDVKKGYENFKYASSLAARSAKVASYKHAYAKAFKDKAVLSGADALLQKSGLSIIDTKPTITTQEFQHNAKALAESMGYENIIFNKGLAKSINNNSVTLVRTVNGERQTTDIKMTDLKYHFEGYSETNLKDYSKAFLNKKAAKSETIIANHKRIQSLIGANEFLDRMNLKNMSSAQIEKALKKFDQGKGVWEKFDKGLIENNRSTLLAIMANKRNYELEKKKQSNGKKLSKQLSKSAQKQAQDTEFIQGYNKLATGKNIIVRTITTPRQLAEMYHHGKKAALTKQINKNVDNRTTRLAKREFEKLYGEHGSYTKIEKRREASAKRKRERKEARTVRRQGRRADRKLRVFNRRNKYNNALRITQLQKYKNPKEIFKKFFSALSSKFGGHILFTILGGIVSVFLSIMTYIFSLIMSFFISIVSFFAPFFIVLMVIVGIIPALFGYIASGGGDGVDISTDIENQTIIGVSAIGECFTEFAPNFDLSTKDGKYKMAAVLGNIDYTSGFSAGINQTGLGICGWCNDADGLTDEDVIQECMDIGGSDPFDFDNPDEALRSQIKYAEYNLANLQTELNTTYTNIAKATEAFAKSSMFNVTVPQWEQTKGERIQRAKNMYKLVLAFYEYDHNAPNEYMIDHLYEDGSWVTSYAIGFMLAAQEGNVSGADVYSSVTNWNRDFVTYCLNNSGIAGKYNMDLSSSSLSYSAYATSQNKYLTKKSISQDISLLKPGYVVCYKAGDNTTRYGIYIGNDGTYMLLADGYSSGTSYYLESSEGAFKKYSKKITGKSVIGKKLKITSSTFLGVYAWY